MLMTAAGDGSGGDAWLGRSPHRVAASAAGGWRGMGSLTFAAKFLLAASCKDHREMRGSQSGMDCSQTPSFQSFP